MERLLAKAKTPLCLLVVLLLCACVPVSTGEPPSLPEASSSAPPPGQLAAPGAAGASGSSASGAAGQSQSAESPPPTQSAVPGAADSSGSSASGAAGQSQSAESPPPPESLPSEDAFLNTALFSLIGQPLSALKAGYGEDYFFHGVGAMTDALVYYDPYICFYSSSIISGMDGTYPDPLSTDKAIIQRWALQADYDPAANAVTGQASLHRLFATGEMITYDLLAKELQQTPTLQHNPGGGYQVIAAHELPQWQPLENGTYDAVFVVEGRDVSVTFVESGGTYMALAAAAG